MKSSVAPCLRIEWRDSIEDVPLFPKREPPAFFYTVEYGRESKKWVRYHPSIRTFRNKNVIRYEITYARHEHPEFEPSHVDWGTTEIIIDKVSSKADVYWRSESRPNREGPIQANLVEQGERSRTNARPNKRNQSQLRRLLLDTDRICAITGENTEEVLECAHIVPVSNAGFETDRNAILLRADLHCLYDSGLFEISPEGKVTKLSPKLSDAYRDLLKGKRLSDVITLRVTDSLGQRRS